jgi:hypothetical protein
MTEAEWMACTAPGLMLEFVGGKVSERKLRLFVVACAWSVCDLVPGGEMRTTVGVAERYADGLASGEELQAAALAASSAYWGEVGVERAPAFLATFAAKDEEGLTRYWRHPYASRWASREVAHRDFPDAEARHCRLLRCIVGNPCRPAAAVDPLWLTWRGGALVSLAQAAYDNRHLPTGLLHNDRLAVLADALEDAGCQDAAFLGHLRSGGEHVRGCFAVDALLDKP